MLLSLVTLLVHLLQITQITFHTPYYTVFTVSSPNKCIYTITIVLCVLRTQENHHIISPSTILSHLLLLIYFAKCLLGVAEFTTQLLRLIGILWLLLCRINKLGYTYPRRLLRSPTLVGHQAPSRDLCASEVESTLDSSRTDFPHPWGLEATISLKTWHT